MAYTIVKNGQRVSEADATLSVFDDAILRGDAAFEVARCYGGRIFAADRHLDRLQQSTKRLRLQLPPRHSLEEWMKLCATTSEPDCFVRVLVTRGSSTPYYEKSAPPTIFVMAQPLPPHSPEVRLLPLDAPWHPAGKQWHLLGADGGMVKWTSYGPNMAATRAACERGFDDALLVSADGSILEGPTFCVGWFDQEGTLETPSLSLDILASVTREGILQTAAKHGIVVREGVFNLEHLMNCSEAFAMSTLKEITPIVAIGTRTLPAGEHVKRLHDLYRAYVQERLDSGAVAAN